LAFGVFSWLIIAVTLIIMFYIENRYDSLLTQFDFNMRKDIIFSSVVLFLIVTLGVFNQKSFIYFQF
jgi:TRAP-type uncharacterized transport system fused permease subunit